MFAVIANAGRTLNTAVRGSGPPLSQAEISQIVSFARIILIVGLVFIHYESYPNIHISPFRGLDPEQHQVATFFQSFVLFFFFSVVPLLSMISGWLFFSFKTDAKEALLSRVRRRFTSLYLPLVFWNALYLLVLWVLFRLDPGAPLLKEIKYNLATTDISNYVNAVFGLTQHPIGFQFWFVRDLFLTVLVSPVLWLFLRYAPWLGAALFGAAWLSGFDLWIFFRLDVLFFFYLGGWVRMRQLPVQISARATLFFLGLYITAVALRTLAPYVMDNQSALLQVMTRGMRVFGVLACWGVFQRVGLTAIGARMARYGCFAFFVHAAHYPLIAEIKIVLWQLVPAETQFWMVMHYIASVTVTVLIAMLFGILLARSAPQWFAFLNGGRVVPAHQATPLLKQRA